MKKALTIGELLITMAIIGTIATLVLPGFLKDYHKKIYVARLKKSVELIENAINQACIDNNVSYFYQTPYAASNDKTSAQAFIDKYFKTTNNDNTSPFAKEYKSIVGGKNYTFNPSNIGFAKLASGEAISFTCDTSCYFRVDTNSTDGPNTGGRDLFFLRINTRSNKIETGDIEYCGGNKITDDKNVLYELAQIIGAQGEGCYGRLLQDNWEMKY